MHTQLIINSLFNETRIAVLEKSRLSELFIERKSNSSMVGNVYKGRVEKVVSGVQAAFVDIGGAQSGFLSAEDVYNGSPDEFFLEEDKVSRRNRQPIQQILRRGQEVMVQVTKEPSGNKGPKVTSLVGIPGKYLVLLPGVDTINVSRKIKEKKRRKNLSEIVQGKPKDVGFIMRTACVGIDAKHIKTEMGSLVRKWRRVKKKYDTVDSPSMVYQEADTCVRVVRDIMGNGLQKVVVDSDNAYGKIVKYFSDKIDNGDFKVELYKRKEPIFDRYGIESQIEKMYKKKVWMKSGGHLIIDEAEGLTVVDVNSGRLVGEEFQEETIIRTNEEAAVEAARQIRLRNLVGIVVIDFIDMQTPKARRKIESLFSEEMKRDKAKTTVLKMSAFSVLQLTRQRLRESILSGLTDTCVVCEGSGRVKSVYTVCYEIMRDIDKWTKESREGTVLVSADRDVIKKLKEIEAVSIRRLRRERGLRIKFNPTDGPPEKFSISREKTAP